MADQRPVVWLCGFPSSGNLKAQLGLANLTFGRVTSITDLDTKIPVMSIGPDVPSSPDVHPVNFVFSHHVANQYMLSRVKSYRIIYVVRDPVDAGISSAGYLLPRYVDMGSASDEVLNTAKMQLIDDFLKIGSYKEYVSYDYGTWSTHVLSWLEYAASAKVPMLVVKFDDMRHRGSEVLQEMAEFIGLSTKPDRITSALDNWTIAASSAMEEQAISQKEKSRFYKAHWASAYARGWRYHGKGLSGYGREHLSPEQWQRARCLFGAMADRIGLAIG